VFGSGTKRCSVIASAVVFVIATLANMKAASAFDWSIGNDAKSGRFMANLKIRPAIGVKDANNQFALLLDGGFAVTPDGNGYVLFALQFHFGGSPSGFGSGSFTGLFVPFGFQYDFALPVPGLFIYPRLLLGYAAFFANYTFLGVEFSRTSHFFTIIPEF